MFVPTYLQVSRHGVFQLRWPLPRLLHPQQKPSFIKISLRTREPKQALPLSQGLAYVGRLLLMQGTAQGMDYAEIRAKIVDHFTKFVANWRARIDKDGPLNEIDIRALTNSLEGATQGYDGYKLNIVTGDADVLASFIQKYDLPVLPGSAEYTHLARDLPKGYRDACQQVLAYNASLESFDLTQRPAPVASTVAPDQRITKASIALKEATDRFYSEMERAEGWAVRTKEQKRAQLDLLIEVLGADMDIGGITALDAQRMKDVVMRNPKNRRKNPTTE